MEALHFGLGKSTRFLVTSQERSAAQVSRRLAIFPLTSASHSALQSGRVLNVPGYIRGSDPPPPRPLPIQMLNDPAHQIYIWAWREASLADL